MARTTRALSGAAKNAFLRRAIATAKDVGAEAGERLTARLQEEIAQLRVREKSVAAADLPAASDTSPAASDTMSPAAADARGDIPRGAGGEAFDPFTPNVVVVVRKEGGGAALADLRAIADPARLRALAAAQSLAVPADAEGVDAVAAAIVAAAERRIANRRAAAR